MTDSEQKLDLAADFPAADDETWLKLVDKTLGGKPFDKVLVKRTFDDIAIKPLYTREDRPTDRAPAGLPGFAPFTRGATAAGTRGGWDIRQRYRHPDPAEVNAEILRDLERGATSATLTIDPGGKAGTVIHSLVDLDRALDGVLMDLAPVALDAGSCFVSAAALLAALWERRGLAGDKVLGAFNADPLGALAIEGSLTSSVAAAVEDMASLAVHTADRWPNVTAVQVSTLPYHGGGASEAQELAYAMATGVAYLRAMEAEGLKLKKAAGQIVFTLAADADVFLTIAKLRAARRLWSRVLEACGIRDVPPMKLIAETAPRMMTRRDPWVNMLRTTVSAFAAGVAGAQSVTVLPFDHAVTESDSFARRIARNIQVILQEESALARVIDPAGGSWAVESLTDELAGAAWMRFQAIEAADGMAEHLTSGKLAEEIDAVAKARAVNIARRKDPITGVSEFPNINEKPLPDRSVDVAAIIEQARGRAGHTEPASADLDDLIAAARDGAGMEALAAPLAGDPASITPLKQHRLAEAFEALRDVSDRVKAKTGTRPRIFLANLGRIAEHTARATFARNVFEAGGIEAVPSDGFTDAEAAAEAYKASDAELSVICGSDEQYGEMASAMARALKAAGAQQVYLAGRPGEAEAALKEAGVDDFVYMGCDVLAVLTDAMERLGLAAEEAA